MTGDMLKIDQKLLDENAALIAEATKLYSQINGAWIQIADYFAGLGILKPCQTAVVATIGESDYAIGLGKHKGRWEVYVITVMPATEKWVRITESQLEHRVDFLEHVPALLEALVASNQEVVETMREYSIKLQG